MDVSVIIVNYNTKQLLADCLRSVYAQTKGLDFEVIVSDNGSVDGSVEMLRKDFAQVTLLENKANLGFGAANNRGLAVAKGKYVFYLNSDTVLLNNAIKYFFDYFEQNAAKENIGALGGILYDSDWRIVRYADRFPNFKSDIRDLAFGSYGFWKLFLKKLLFNKELPPCQQSAYGERYGEADFIVGADLFVKNDKSAYFDQDFFMYNEEIYLQYLMSLDKKKRLVIKGPKIVHLEGKSSKQEKIDAVHSESAFCAVQKRLSAVLYYKKTGVPAIKVFLLQVLTALFWLNPFLIKTNAKFIGRIFGYAR
ncbi:MAG: glycosyltransferase [Treponema sp.]|nr:glycosyltransferase [Treponema sp.]